MVKVVLCYVLELLWREAVVEGIQEWSEMKRHKKVTSTQEVVVKHVQAEEESLTGAPTTRT